MIDDEPSLSRWLTEDEFDHALGSGRQLRRPQVALHPRPFRAASAELAHEAAVASRHEQRTERARCDACGLGRGLRATGRVQRDLGQAGSAGHQGEWERVRLHPYLRGTNAQPVTRARPSWQRSRCSTASDSTGRGTPPGSPAARSRGRRGCSPPPTCINRCASHDRTREALSADDAARKPPRTRSEPADSTATRSTPCYIAAGHRVSRNVATTSRGSLRAKSRCCGCVARGMTNKAIAQRLVISPKTAGNHVEHIYTKIGATSRSTASLFAMQHGLLAGD